MVYHLVSSSYRDWMLSFFPDGRVIFVPQCLTLHGTEELYLETGVALFHLLQTTEQGKSSDNCNAGSCLHPPPRHVCIWEQCYDETITHWPVSSNFTPFLTECALSRAAPSVNGNASIPYLSTHPQSCFYWTHHRNIWELLFMENRLSVSDR